MIDNIKQKTTSCLMSLTILILIISGEFVHSSFSSVAIAMMLITSSIILCGLFCLPKLVDSYKEKFSFSNMLFVVVLEIFFAAYAAYKNCDYLLYMQCVKSFILFVVMIEVNKKIDKKENA